MDVNDATPIVEHARTLRDLFVVASGPHAIAEQVLAYVIAAEAARAETVVQDQADIADFLDSRKSAELKKPKKAK